LKKGFTCVRKNKAWKTGERGRGQLGKKKENTPGKRTFTCGGTRGRGSHASGAFILNARRFSVSDVL